MDAKQSEAILTRIQQPRNVRLLATVVAILFVTGFSLVGGVAADTDGFAVEMNETEPTAAAGETVSVSATVTNTGSSEASQQIHLKQFDGSIVDSVAHPPLTLAPGETESVVLRWNTTTADVGNGTISAQSNDAFPTRPLRLVDPATVETTVGAVPDSVTRGESLTVPVTVTNTGEYAIETDAWIEIDNRKVTNQSVAVDAGESTQLNLTWTPTDVGTQTLTSGTAYGETTHNVTVYPPTDSTATDTTSSSGGGAAPNVADRLRASVTDRTATFAGGDIRQITFDTPVSGDIVATRFHDQPDGVEAVPSALTYYRITVPAEAADHNASITFQLPDTVDTETERVGVSRWNGTGWESLNTTVADSGDEITANTTGFSVFALTVSESPGDAAATPETDSSSTVDDSAESSGLIDSLITAGGYGLLLLAGALGVIFVAIGSVGILLATRQRGAE